MLVGKGVGVGVTVGTGVLVGVTVWVGMGVAVGVEVGVADGEGVAVSVKVGHGVRVVSLRFRSPAISRGTSARTSGSIRWASEQPIEMIKPKIATRITQRGDQLLSRFPAWP